MSVKAKRISQRRLRRDLKELKQANLLSIAAHPMDDNIYEWHANIKPNDGVYAGVYFHLILNFPIHYPSKPPEVKIMTPISHPNVFDEFICLSMLREYTGTVPYEGWSGAYSMTSILMQLQSFLFADKIDQDGGYQVNARLSVSDIKRSINICKSFHCSKCNHSHKAPFPSVLAPPKALIPIHITDKSYTKYIDIQGSFCQSISKAVGVYGHYGCNYGKIMYESSVEWIDKTSDDSAFVAFGFGTEDAYICGDDKESFGYFETGELIYCNYKKYDTQPFSINDTIICALDFDSKQIYLAKNGKLLQFTSKLFIPPYLYNKKQLLFPILSLKRARAAFNFGTQKKPSKWLIQNGFKTLEEIAMNHGVIKNKQRNDCDNRKKKKVEWHSKYIIDELWVEIFEYLCFSDVFHVQFVCIKWNKITDKYNIMERGEIYCYFTKIGLAQNTNILGIGLNICESDVGYRVELNSQMDILSYGAWRSGCRIGVWGEALTHFLPLPMNKFHAEHAYDSMINAMKCISSKYKEIQIKSYHGRERMEHPNKLEEIINNSLCLQMVDTLITMMNQLVANFVNGNEETDPKQVSMVLCEKVVLGYCALHHLLLYLRSKNKKEINRFANKTIESFIQRDNGPSKAMTRDLGKLLIYLMLSRKYEWKDIAQRFVEESFTRRVRWFVKNESYKIYNTTAYVPGRIRDSFISSKTGRRLVRFQVWFMANNALETLKGYNDRLGRPKREIRNGIVNKTKEILSSTSYDEYFKELNMSLRDEAVMDQLLRFAVYNSYYRGYHWNTDVHSELHHLIYRRVNSPLKRHNYNIGNNEENKSTLKRSNKKKNKSTLKRSNKDDKENKKKNTLKRSNKNDKETKKKNKSVYNNGDREKKETLSKASKRKLRKKKMETQKCVKPLRPPLSLCVLRQTNTLVKNGPIRPPLPCKRFRAHIESQNKEKEAKLSKAQRRKLRRNKNKNGNQSK